MSILHKDPPSAPRRMVLPRSIFDPSPHRNIGQPQIREEMAAVPDALLISTLVAHGQPLFAAQEATRHPTARFHAFRFWCDVQDAAEGDKAAKERVDYCRGQWEEMRKVELIAERPSHTIGLWER
jgi:hypothetical protein